MFDFPYGKAALALLFIAVVSGVGIVIAATQEKKQDIDLVFATFASNHVDAYRDGIAQFEKDNPGVKVSIQVFSGRALNERLQASMAIGAEVPDMVEIGNGTLATFTRGPIEDVQFRDLTEVVEQSGLKNEIPISRFSLWTTRGRTFALPHDVHPVMLAYRADLVEELGIDVERDLKTWEDFLAVGQRITKDLDGDGAIDRFMIDLPEGGGDAIRLLTLQSGGRLIDENNNLLFESDEVAKVMAWYIRATRGPKRVAFSAGWGQALSTSMIQGTCLFYLCPDWRTNLMQTDVAAVSGKMKLMPLPVWREGGVRTSTWGGTGLAFPKGGKNFELALKLGKYLYYNPTDLGERFDKMYILPPIKSAWDEPQLKTPRPFWSNQPIGTMMAQLAPDVPGEFVSAYTSIINARLGEALYAASREFETRPDMSDDELLAVCKKEIASAGVRIRREINHNSFQPPKN
jgi:arabinosaccharide transport system substrate-binding protein